MPSLKKPIIILTNFWDAESILELGTALISVRDKDLICRLNFLKDEEGNPKNFSVHSIALSHPDFKRLPNVKEAFGGRLDHFCPTYDMVMDYKRTKDWKRYIPLYKQVLLNRKRRIVSWMESLEKDHIYILCCWEDTSGESHCHRELLYKAFLTSKTANDMLYPILRDGAGIFKQKSTRGILEEVKEANRKRKSRRTISAVQGSRRNSETNYPTIIGVDLMNNRYYVEGPNGDREYIEGDDLLRMGYDVYVGDEEWDE